MSLDGFQQILNRIKSRYPALRDRIKESEAVSLWEEVVGPGIGKHTRVLRVEDGIFHVEVDHPAWKTELFHRKAQILLKINERMKVQKLEIKDLFLVEKKYSYQNRGKPTSFLPKKGF